MQGSHLQLTRGNTRGRLEHWVILAVETIAILAKCISEVDSWIVLGFESDRFQGFGTESLVPVFVNPLWKLDPISWISRSRGGR